MSNLKTITHEQLVLEVYTLQDQYIRMKKMYEDLFYNLDYDNFSSALSVDMQNFKLTFSEVFPNGAKAESAITMNAQEIRTWVAVNYQTQLEAGFMETNLYSSITQTAESITSVVSATYETKGSAEYQYSHLQSSITQTAASIRSEVFAQYGTVKKLSVIEQTVDEIGMYVEDSTSESKLQLTSSFIKLMSAKIIIDGVVRFTNEGKYPAADGSNITEIDGGKITTGIISADRIEAGSISWNKIIAPQVDLVLYTYYHRALEINQSGAVTNITEFNKGLGDAVQNIYDSLASIQTALRTAKITK